MFNLTPTVRNLLIANVLVLVIGGNLVQNLTQFGALYPVSSPYFYPWQFVTYMFLHAGWGHLIGNMFALISFGPMLEQRWGGQRFLIFWLVCGVGAGLLYEGVRYYEIHQIQQAAVEFAQQPSGGGLSQFFENYAPQYSGYQTLARAMHDDPRNAEYIDSATKAVQGVLNEILTSPGGGMVGASGAVFGILFAFAYLFPNTELMLLFFPFPIKAKYFVFFYALYELYAGVHRTPGDNVAHFAHLGGLLIGFIIIKVWERGRRQFY
ncbi:MAG TPA: rhomboid family intramembrane serine protease [Hymenobacter sp.]|uniref:rhomboid family intramembrane serine protease n=1 Tax=Hymenobacter sp. TaxID=1898978 RepID=UPI002D7FEBF7|nr:rhomboid family intramembrane serine protease [Hymenobacter sp.]HET9506170.1 rhomboid family intramembrane serine protease [Hymenobacter sp.]